MYYTIQNNEILIAETEQALTRFYDNVLPLPIDYEDGKYIVEDGELVLNPNWEEEQEEKRKQLRNLEIDSKIKELNEMAIPDILHGNKENIELYNEVIAGLEAARP